LKAPAGVYAFRAQPDMSGAGSFSIQGKQAAVRSIGYRRDLTWENFSFSIACLTDRDIG
jgi:hypothetical protein